MINTNTQTSDENWKEFKIYFLVGIISFILGLSLMYSAKNEYAEKYYQCISK